MDEETQKLEKEKEEILKEKEKLSNYMKYGWIVCLIIVLTVSIPIFLKICLLIAAIYVSSLLYKDNQKYSEKQERIDKKLYELEHTPEKEKEREKAQKEKEKAEKQKIREEKEKEIQEQIEKYTPFKTVEEAKGYYIYRLGWELNNNKLQSVDLLLCNSQNKLKDLHFKYKKGKIINAPFGTTEENFLHINRQKIYMLNDDDEQQQAIELFREIFGKDPFTGEDIVSEKEESE